MRKIVFGLLVFLLSSSYVLADTLVWDLNDCADYYIVYAKTDADANWTEVYKTTSENEVEVNLNDLIYKGEKLKTNTTYYFSVKAFNVYGNSSDYSDSVNYVIYKPLAPMLNIAKHAITWTYEDNSELAGFEVTVSAGSTTPIVKKVDKTIRGLDLVPLNLTNGMSYNITVKAYSTSGVYGDSSNSVIYTRRSPSRIINLRINKTKN